VRIGRIDRDKFVRSYVPGMPIPALIKDEDGRIVQNPMKPYVKPFFLEADQFSVDLPANGEPSDAIPYVIDQKGHYEVISSFFHSEQPEGFTVQLSASAADAPILSNREVHVATIASGGGVNTNLNGFFDNSTSAGRPFRWPESYWMNVDQGGRILYAVFRNLSPNPNIIRFTLVGRRWYHQGAEREVAQTISDIYDDRARFEPFFYTTEVPVTLGPNQSSTPLIDIRFTDGVWAEHLKSMAFATQGPNSFKCDIMEKMTQKKFMERRLSGNLVFGNGEYPYFLWESSLYEPNYKLSMTFENLSDQENQVFVTLGCRHIRGYALQ
jgi:hypothetical protein